jgi:hypothetical protein
MTSDEVIKGKQRWPLARLLPDRAARMLSVWAFVAGPSANSKPVTGS